MADLALRHLQIQLPAPNEYANRPPVVIELIHAVEENPPENTEVDPYVKTVTLQK
jgi:hypothetical protein